MTTITPIFRQYLSIFDEVSTIELIRAPELDREKITTYIQSIQMGLKIHTYFMPENIKNVITEIISHTAIRDYVFCTTDRFLIYLAGNKEISYLDLTRIISAVCRESHVDQYRLMDSILPKAIVDEMSPPQADVIGVLTANKMLMIPLMIALNTNVSIVDPIETKTKKS